MALTPMLQQYFDIKKKYPNEILLFRMGDFYEVFGEDALVAAKILQIALTARNKGTPNEIPMCGVPHHALDNYLSKLTKAKKSAAICEQLSDPSAPGLVQRDVTRVVTPGTTFDAAIINSKENNFIISVVVDDKAKTSGYGLAVADVTTGEFGLTDITDIDILKTEIAKLNPGEIILSNEVLNQPDLNDLWSEWLYRIHEPLLMEPAVQFLQNHFKMPSLQGFGVAEHDYGINAAAILLHYLQETQKTTLDHINNLYHYNTSGALVLDRTTIRNLDLFYSAWDGAFQGSLLWVLDQTSTAMGGRLLRKWLLRPLLDKEKIEQRLQAVAWFHDHRDLLPGIIELLEQVSDIERILAKVGCQRAHARDLVALKHSLKIIPALKEVLLPAQDNLIAQTRNTLNEHQDLVDLLNRALLPEPGLGITDGNIIADGYDPQVDEWRIIMNSGKDLLDQMQTKEREVTGINNLKIKFNKVFGYYIEISKGSADQAPDYYTRKQTLVNAERFITPELKEYEDKVLGAEEKLKQREFELFNKIREQVNEHLGSLQTTAQQVAQLDVWLSLAQVALQNNYCQPDILKEPIIDIQNGRHPVIEKTLTQTRYIPNDTKLDNQDHQFVLLTGPNMSGKSSFLRQTALIVLMAHIGSFVPAQAASIGLTDRIFTRVGASDNLGKGESTFMVEMQEAAVILHNATDKSLIIFDELGRGTSTYDGLSLAWAITEFIHNTTKAKTLFATHYHELIDVVKNLKHAQNYSVAVQEDKDKVLFLHKVIPGGIDKSYGVEVAKLAGLPKPIVVRALEILNHLESTEWAHYKNKQRELPLAPASPVAREHPAVQALKDMDLNNLTPIEALNKLQELQDKV